MPKTSEYRELTAQELVARLDETREELFRLRFQHATGQLDNPALLPQTRKQVARLATLVGEQELSIYVNKGVKE